QNLTCTPRGNRARTTITTSDHNRCCNDPMNPRLHEGTCAQVLHIGSYDDETPLLATLHDEYVPANTLALAGMHHEIYLGDPRRSAPEKLKTVLRQPVKRSPRGGSPG
ncbi:GyrI-like domain-containing protein, partial [Amycolatopsis minnesotensis]|uniref:GyrI-like domain-containing protein n=1 Tax=Amycolatopsis minnesotensis TaxID=337894 RepID=UPI0031CDAEF7